MTKKRACVIVLGDVGRSPRMQYHALSLAKEEYDVDVVGYSGSSPYSDVLFSSRISFHFMKQPPVFSYILPKFISYFLKVIWQTCFLAWILLWIPKPNFYLVQNPPSVPTLPICWLISRLRRSQLIIDWHNYGYTIMGLVIGPNHILTRISYHIEALFGRFANLNFCVTKAMSYDLQQNWGVRAITLYDRPAEIFQPVSLPEKHELFLKLGKDYHEFSSSRPDDTLLTERFADGQVRLREDRPGLLISSTSWTEDEDFSILLDALDEYELNRSVNSSDYPPLMCVITGKGPLKSYYSNIIQAKQWQHVEICTPWLEPEDYPKLIASADLGVCLHTSSSGFDLPMKVVDMFGCGLPVCAVGYNCLDELITDKENGMIFKTAGDLADQLLNWFHGFPRDNEENRQFYRQNLKVYQNLRWHEEWRKIVLPHLPSTN
ncbi:chitobiosyldiphosphodolichol beta-mannosyltransferase-like [Daphnia carinata]|uniref:chitobiosyldiphosphodolichol beta-mannosyltransferase-like n=1 Tax=Daphnia carinata TaxID=120202 RepID=UPI002579A6EB|nr:chitobiosyldiphosphodolichol beta-mannosyltransferase-like [Daphnia carinata]